MPVKVIDPEEMSRTSESIETSSVAATNPAAQPPLDLNGLDKDEAFQAIVLEGVAIAKAERSQLMLARWAIGGLVKKIKVSYADGSIQKFCEELRKKGAVDYTYKTVMKCRQFHDAVSEDQARRLADQGFAIRNIEKLMSPKVDDRERARMLDKAASGEISQKQMIEHIDTLIEKADSPTDSRNIGPIDTSSDAPASLAGRDVTEPNLNDFTTLVANLDGVLKRQTTIVLKEFEKLPDRYMTLDTKGRKAVDPNLQALLERLHTMSSALARGGECINDCLRA